MKVGSLRGVNLGGWLVLERWITPSLFVGVSGTDEHTLVQELGQKRARERLERHWSSFITEKHLRKIKQMGLNAVRLPVGYWLFEDQDGFLGGSYEFVDKLFDWSERHNLGVVLCLHGAPGSQNGYDHSGRQGLLKWFKGSNLKKSKQIIERLSGRYGQKENLIGIELVNEPSATNWWRRFKLLRYYKQAGRTVEEKTKGAKVVLSDAFRSKLIPKIVRLPLKEPVIDTHLYQLFTDEDRALDFEGHINKTKGWAQELSRATSKAQVLVGEWSAAMDELYDPDLKTKARTFSKSQHAAFAAEQRRVFELSGVGWFYWTARTEDKGVWSLLDNPKFIK